MRRALALLALGLLAARVGITSSGADFTVTSASPGNSFATATDFNTVTVSLDDPGALLRSSVTLTATAGSERGIADVRFQSSPAGAGSWIDACVATTAPYSCNWDTTAVAEGLRDLRAIATDDAGYQRTSTIVASRLVDNAAPSTATLTNPGSSLQGTVTLSGTAADAGSGIADWTVQYRPSGTTTWTAACSETTSPYSCSWATAGVTDGLYDLRGLARDQAGNTTGSTVISSVRIDNVVPTVSLTDPGSPLVGTVTLNATASDGGGIASVVIERSPTGANTWTTICTDTSSAYSCAFDTTAVAQGGYDLRARTTDNGGRTATSAVVSNRVVNRQPYGTDIQTTNGGTAGRIDANDTVRLTYSEAMAPASMLSGWTGASQAIRIYVTDGGTVDTMDFRNSTGTTRLNLVNTATDLSLAANFVIASAVFNATMAMSGTVVTITVGSRISGTVTTSSALAKMTWRAATASTDVSGLAALNTLVTESGTNDRDF